MSTHFDFSPTPLIRMERWSRRFGCNLLMKRDDLFEHGGGGSKARMLQYILWSAKEKKADYILTAGGPHSNFNRALALLCKMHNFHMKLVLYDKNAHINRLSLNKRVLDYCKIDIVYCSPDQVVQTVDKEKKNLLKNGHNPYYIWGGGKSNEGVQAYIDAFKEIQSGSNCIDYIFTPLGTGTTFSGLLAGAAGDELTTKILGISVAREKAAAEQVVKEILTTFGINVRAYLQNGMIIDNYLLGGYGKSNCHLDNFIRDFIQEEGLIIDPIYVGKALYGMYHYLNENNTLIKGKTIIFINTGGIFNF